DGAPRERVERALEVATANQLDGLEGGDGRPGHVGIHRAQLTHEARGARLLPDVHRGLEADQVAATRADVALAQLRGGVAGPPRLGLEVLAEARELVGEVAIEILLQAGEGGGRVGAVELA